VQAITQKPFYTRIALLGVAAILTLAAILFVPIVIFSPGDLVFPIIIAVIALVVGALITFIPQPWGLIFAVLGGIFCLLFASDGLDLSLGNPDSFFDFIFPLFFIAGAILLLSGGIGGLIHHFRHSEGNSNQTLVTVAKGIVAVVGVLMVISAVLTVVNLGSASASEKEGAAYVKAKDTKFSTDKLSASPTGKIAFDNRDPILHTLTIDDLDIDLVVGPGSHEVVTLENAKAGDYIYRCRVSGHEDMAGTLTVK
jgi:plastocyanin